MPPVVESNGLFTASFPAGWDVLQIPAARATALFGQQNPGEDLKALMVGKPPGADPEAYVLIFVIGLAKPITPLDVWLAAGTRFGKAFPEFKSLEDGLDTIGGREMYYNHFTWRAPADSGPSRPSYSVLLMFSSAAIAYIFVGTTLNDPGHIHEYGPIFRQIAETLTPSQ